MIQVPKDRFGGVARLHGDQGLQKLASAHVCVIGIGGVGSWACEALARSGIGEISLIDADDICVTNINRQIHAVSKTIGQEKVTAMAQRIGSINPDCKVHALPSFLLEANADSLLSSKYDFVVDAIDSVKHKCILIALCKQKGLKLVSVGGAGGKTEIKDIQLLDLGLTYQDKLLSKVRSILRKQYGFPKYKGKKFKIMSVFSPETVKLPWCEVSDAQQRTSLKLDCNNGFGTDMTVISTFGITAAHYVMSEILKADIKTTPES